MASLPIVRQAVEQRRFSVEVANACERLAATFLLLIAAPVVIPCGFLVWLLSGRGPLIAHRRVGWRGEDLWMIKMRSMWQRRDRSAEFQWVEYLEDQTGPPHKRFNDPRVTSAFARFCRRHSIDELPQLWHVMTGEMSLVGPRPITKSELDRYYGPAAHEVLGVKPGIAGLWQVSGRNRLTYEQRRALDLQLVRRRSLRLYLSILLRTVPELLSGANSW